MKADIHPRQAERLAALRSYDILDTPREADYNDIAALASEICDVPISVINLIDANRQWFKAEVGLGVRETPLDTSICAHVILEDDFVEIPDTLSDARMRDNALCAADPGLRFYAGVLLKTEDGLPIGTLCVLDYKPNGLQPFQKRALQVLAKQVMAQLDLRRALKRQALLQQEADHRIKNSLQSVISFVRLQAARAKTPAIADALADVEKRIQTIALLHAELYRTSAMGEVDLAHYITKLREMLLSNAPANVTIRVELEPVAVVSTNASAIGIIVNEFVTNSIKHAFPDGRAGEISISLKRLDGGDIEMALSDDGIGAPKTPTNKRGLGLRIIDASAAQIGARVERPIGPNGVQFKIVFKS